MAGSRRVRRRSVSTCPLLPTYVALLEPLQLRLQSARDSKRPLFILQVQRRSSSNNGRHSPTGSNHSWSSPRPFEDFEALHKRMILALQHGHFCNAGCPWLFSFLSSEFPKKHIFQRNFSPRIVETRREKLLELLTSTLEFLLDRKNHACAVAATDVAKLVAEFLYGEDAVTHFIVESYSESEASTSTAPNDVFQFQHVYELTSPASSSSPPITSPTSFRPPTIAYLDQFELSVTASKVMLNHGKDVRYDLIVTPTSDSSQQWTVSRSFKELQEFQHKLLEVMQLGHLCHAGCPYLYSSIKDRFPKECYLCSSSSYVMGKRRQALEECFTSLLEALRKRENHSSCSILPGTVAQEFITFLNEDLPIDHKFLGRIS
ncbi:Phox homologous domain [Phytophthora cactorum]|nr:Phox homologous domain [Phytophthora cactorum]